MSHAVIGTYEGEPCLAIEATSSDLFSAVIDELGPIDYDVSCTALYISNPWQITAKDSQYVLAKGNHVRVVDSDEFSANFIACDVEVELATWNQGA